MISNVLYIPSMKKYLLSIRIITNRGYTIFFDAKKCIAVNPRKLDSIVVHGNKHPINGLYKLEICVAVLNRNVNEAMKKAKLWHRKMGHVNFKSLY